MQVEELSRLYNSEEILALLILLNIYIDWDQ